MLAVPERLSAPPARAVTYYHRVSQVLNGVESDLSDEVAVTIPGG